MIALTSAASSGGDAARSRTSSAAAATAHTAVQALLPPASEYCDALARISRCAMLFVVRRFR